MSFKCCPYLGTKLPDRHSCGVLCAEFPRCLPSLPPTVAGDLAELQTYLSRDALLQRLALLERLDDAIAEGLNRKNQEP